MLLAPAYDAPLHNIAGANHDVSLEEPGVFPYTVRDGALALRYPPPSVPTYNIPKWRSLMNEASVGRHVLAQQIAAHYIANPKVTAVIVGGSVAQGYADRFSRRGIVR